MTDEPPRTSNGHIAGVQVDLSRPFAQLPIREWGFLNCPAIPYWSDADGDPDLERVLGTIRRLEKRGEQSAAAYQGLTTMYTIDGQTAPAVGFLYGEKAGLSETIAAAIRQLTGSPGTPSDAPDTAESVAATGTPPLTELALNQPEQFTLPWTTYGDMYKDSTDLAKVFAGWLTDTKQGAKEATKNFWPTIANFGLPYNLLILNKLGPGSYEIDMRMLASIKPVTFIHPGTKTREVRFTPGTRTLLVQDPKTKDLTPTTIEIYTGDGQKQVYNPDSAAWLYALQAAKTSITVYGIWLGHVYHFHIVTAAMVMTMYNELPSGHRLWPLLGPQTQYLIDFDFVLLMFLWGKIVPPTPVYGYMPLLRLFDQFAKNRVFSDDDPEVELAKGGITKADFTEKTDWDKYPVAGNAVEIWKHTHVYVKAVVEDLYKTDDEVAEDGGLRAWMTASGEPTGGNIRGLPDVRTRAALTGVLTSLLHRITVHGAGGLTPSVHPMLSFMANFPPCLQRADVPKPGHKMTPEQLLAYLPRTGTLGQMTTFYFTFAYSPPYVSLIPEDGVRGRLQFPSRACNEALFTYRERIQDFIDAYITAWNATLARLRGSDPGTPRYAENQHSQWARSIEI